MFRTLDFWIQSLLMLGFIPPILVYSICMLCTLHIPAYIGLSVLVAMFLGPYQIFSAILSLAYEREKMRTWYIISVCLYFGLVTLYSVMMPTSPPNKFMEIIAAAIPISLAIWYYKMTYKAYKELT